MRHFIIERSDSNITSHSGPSLIGLAVNRHTRLVQRLDRTLPLRHGIRHSDIVKSYLGLLSLGKSDFEAIDARRDDEFFKAALAIDRVPSVERLRQRMDERAGDYLPLVMEASIDFLESTRAPITALAMGHVALDADVTPFDNSGSKKEGVSRTYKQHDGYAPMACYLGQEGYCVEFELREGSQHCQKGTPALLKRSLERARRLTKAPLLLRLDGGNDAVENMDVVLTHNARHPEDAPVDFIIKWNPRQEDPQAWLKIAEPQAVWTEPRPGKRVGLFDVSVKRHWNGYEYRLRRVMRVVERTIDRQGQHLAIPEIELEGWWTGLPCDPQEVIDLYADHGTAEQFHSEFKTDMDIERLPSGKFATNALVLACSDLTYNVLRWNGQNGLTGPDASLCHKAKRRRIKTVMQELMYLASKITETGRRLKMFFGRYCRSWVIFDRLYHRLAYGGCHWPDSPPRWCASVDA